MKIDIVLFHGFDELDAIGPYEVLRTAARYGVANEADLVGAHGAAEINAAHGARLVVERGPSERADVLLVPGGGWNDGRPQGVRAEVERGDLPDLLRRTHDAGRTVGSVCTGAMLLAAAGLTAGRPATTHRSAMDDLRAASALVLDERVVDDGDLLTAGGVTAGLDLALWLVELEAGAEIARLVSGEIEHQPGGRVHRGERARAGSTA